MLPYIASIIILSGLLVYLKWNIDDYNRGVEELKIIGSVNNMEVNNAKVNLLLDINRPEDAIEMMLKMILTISITTATAGIKIKLKLKEMQRQLVTILYISLLVL